MAIIVTTQGSGVLFNGIALAGKEGWVLSTSGDQSKVTLTNKITGLSGSALTTEVEVDGSTFADYEGLVAALGDTLFVDGGGDGSGVSSVNGLSPDGDGNVELDASDVGADPTGSAATAESNANSYTDDAIDDLNLGSAAQADTGDFATAAQGSLAGTAVQPSDILDVVRSEQEESVGTVITNIISMTQAEYDGLSSPSASTFYVITD